MHRVHFNLLDFVKIWSWNPPPGLTPDQAQAPEALGRQAPDALLPIAGNHQHIDNLGLLGGLGGGVGSGERAAKGWGVCLLAISRTHFFWQCRANGPLFPGEGGAASKNFFLVPNTWCHGFFFLKMSGAVPGPMIAHLVRAEGCQSLLGRVGDDLPQRVQQQVLAVLGLNRSRKGVGSAHVHVWQGERRSRGW